MEPGHILRIKNGQIKKEPFWQLDPDESTLKLKKDEEYLEQFSALMSEALYSCVDDTSRLAAEFSGGLDSTAVLAAAYQNQISPALFCHMAPEDCPEEQGTEYVNMVLQRFQFKKVHHIDAASFNL